MTFYFPVPHLYHLRNNKDINDEMEFKDQKKDISNILKQICSKSENLNFLLGSGCSLPAIQLMGKTFMDLKSNEPQLTEVLGKYDGDSKDIEGFLNHLNHGLNFLEPNSEYFNSIEDAFKKTKKFLLKSIMLDYYVKQHEQSTPGDLNTIVTLDLYLRFYRSIFSFREFNKQVSPVNVFTTNYDLFSEVSLEMLGIHYTNGFKGYVSRTFDPSVFRLRLVDEENRYKEKWSAVRRFVKLFKIHGSIDWIFDEKDQIIKQSNSFNNEFTNDSQQILIYPTLHKHLESQQSPYSELFREFTNHMQRKNSTLIVIGYGFPDEHINQLISQSLQHDDFNLIVFGNKIEQNAKLFIEKHKEKSNFHFIGGNYANKEDGHFFSNVIQLLEDGINNADSE
ncbi:SIR2 family protein [Paenibacillus sp. FSL R7-277]|uniref:SIR2 family protein n=1 Tax=unclassified Paenibacillus TaxID=185978 RepID=UPI0003E29AB4|nr:SIR2 family protein [Paenibacillus sp. FSL R7-277]ETT69636.1 hypothetical protein C173_17061 [Paenibacillus sp. FSL R7-277]